MAAANAMGDKLPMFVIGKAKNPRCLKNVKFLPRRHRNQRKSWMDGKLFEEWLRELDWKFTFEWRNVVFVVDNCRAHPHIGNLKAIKLYFLPPNTTSKTQPMDQGVIRSLKAKYRKNVVRKIIIQSVEKKKNLPKICCCKEWKCKSQLGMHYQRKLSWIAFERLEYPPKARKRP